MHDTEAVPGPSRQTEIKQQETLQTWLIKTLNQLLFLSQIEHSVSFANLISAFDKELRPEASKKNSIELLLALDDFVIKEKNPSLSIQFFIEKILKNCRFLIDNYRDTYAKLLSLEKAINQSSLTEDPKQLQIKLFNLNKEKKQLQKYLLPDFELTRLIELTNDLEKFRLEHDRDFVREIAMHETELEAHTQKLDEINEKAAKIEEELTFPIDQLEANLNIKKRKLSRLEVDLYALKQITIDGIIEKLSAQLELENTRLSLILELEECDPIKILKTQIEYPNTKQEELRTENKIKKDLAQNAQNLNAITEFFKDIIQLVPSRNNNIIKNFLEKIQLTLNFNIDKNALETKNNNGSTILQEELIVFLQQNSSELIKHLEILADDKQEEKTKLQIEIQNLEILDERNRLNNQISELEEKIQTTKNDKYIFGIIKEKNLLKPLIHLERLQKITGNTIHEIDELRKQIAEVEKQITELKRESDKKDVAKSDFDNNKEKIKSQKKIKILEEKKNKYNLDLKEQLKCEKSEHELAKNYRNEIEKEINIIRDIKTTAWLSKLPHNEKNLRFNSIDIELLTKNIEKQKINATQKKEWTRTKDILNRTEALLLNKTIETTENNNTKELIFFNSLKAQLIDLKEQVENPVWNKSGWSFFFKKVPDGIQKIRELFNAKPFNTSIAEANIEQNDFTMLSLFSEIYPLIQQKNSSTKYLRSSAVKNFYQSLHETLTQINNQFLTLKEHHAEMHDAAQPTCSTSSF